MYAIKTDGTQTTVDATQGYSGNDIARFDGAGRVSSYTPNTDYHVANKKYVDDKIGEIDAALEELHNYAQSLVNGGGTE